MSETADSNYRLVAELLQDAESARNARLQSALKTELEADLAKLEKVSWHSAIATEADTMCDRLIFLARHPKRIRFLGGAATDVKYDRREGATGTEPLWTTEAELVDGNTVTSSVVFKTHYLPSIVQDSRGVNRDAYTLDIDKVLTEGASQTQKTKNLFRIFFWPDKLMKITGEEFDGEFGSSSLPSGEYPEDACVNLLAILREGNHILGSRSRGARIADYLSRVRELPSYGDLPSSGF